MTVRDMQSLITIPSVFSDSLETYNNTVAYNRRKKQKDSLTEATGLMRALWELEKLGKIKIL